MNAQLTPQAREFFEIATPILQELARREGQKLFYKLYPDEDAPAPKSMLDYFPSGIIHARDKYPVHMEFLEAGAEFRERCALCANRVGKTFSLGGYETACHLTGEYPHWWKGKRFDRPIRAWAAGKTNETTRDIVQDTLLGKISNAGKKGFTGTGVVPGKAIGAITWKQGVSDLADTVKIRHISGGWSTLGFKSYQQGRGSFEGTAQHVIWLDEEAPEDVYGECLIRTATTNGIVMLTFTPLEGLTPVVLGFLPEDMRPAVDEDEGVLSL